MTLAAEQDEVVEIESQGGILGPRLDVVDMQLVRCSTLLAASPRPLAKQTT
jgi:hypothetical protein